MEDCSLIVREVCLPCGSLSGATPPPGFIYHDWATPLSQEHGQLTKTFLKNQSVCKHPVI